MDLWVSSHTNQTVQIQLLFLQPLSHMQTIRQDWPPLPHMWREYILARNTLRTTWTYVPQTTCSSHVRIASASTTESFPQWNNFWRFSTIYYWVDSHLLWSFCPAMDKTPQPMPPSPYRILYNHQNNQDHPFRCGLSMEWTLSGITQGAITDAWEQRTTTASDSSTLCMQRWRIICRPRSVQNTTKQSTTKTIPHSKSLHITL